MISLDDQIKEVEQELAYRRRAFPKRVAARRMFQIDADRRIAALQAVLETLRRVKAERAQREPLFDRQPEMAVAHV